MKKILIILTFLLTQQISAKSYEYEITPVIGYTFNDSYLPLDNYPIYGAEMQFNIQNNFFVPEIAFYFERGNYDYQNSDEPDIYTQTRNIYTISLNAVHEFERSDAFLPFFKVGLSDRILSVADENRLCHSGFLNLGLGAKVYLTENIALKIESLYMVNYNNKKFNQHVSLIGGLNIAFGETQYYPDFEKSKPVKVVRKRATVQHNRTRYMEEPINIEPTESSTLKKLDFSTHVPLDDDHDGVSNSVDDCLNTPAYTKVNAFGCRVVENVLEEQFEETIEEDIQPRVCLDTIYKKIADLNIKFLYKSFHLTPHSKDELSILISFLKENQDYDLKVIGYTDNIASKAYNQRLSQKRAQSIKNYLSSSGIATYRITALGLGEKYPIATNNTKAGRAKNRRTEIILLKK